MESVELAQWPDFNADEPHMRLATGEMFNLAAPQKELITIDNVANALSKLCRYTGQIPDGQGDRLYTVAQHSVLVSHLVAFLPYEEASDLEATRALKYQALLHDAAEAYIGDLSAPLKALINFDEDIKHIEKAVADALNTGYPFHPLVHEADKWAYEIEVNYLWNGVARGGSDLERSLFKCSGPKDAKRLFMNRYIQLTGEEQL